MAVNVYAWPPVSAVGSEWSEVAPVSKSKSLLSGKRYVSSAQPARRVASLVVSSLGSGRMGAGYCEVLKRFLAGGENLVRLRSYPINWYLDALESQAHRQSFQMAWDESGVDMVWEEGATDMVWYDNPIISGTVTTSGGFPAVALTGLPPNTLIARPGEFLTVFENHDDLVGETVQIIRATTSNGSGAATVRVLTAPSFGGRVNMGVSETSVFEVVGELPRSVQTPTSDWSYSWSFKEVFSDEVGGFTELDPWT